MIGVPFIYFSILLIFIIKTKKTFDISAYLVSLYLISSFFSILIDLNNLRSFDTMNYEIGLEPTVVYCFMLTVVIWPFYRFRSEKIAPIKLAPPKLFNWIVYFYFFCFIFIVLLSYESVFKILSGDLGEMRVALSRGESIEGVTIKGGLLKPFFMLANIFGGFSIIMLLFYFYSICFLEKSKYFNMMILLSSTSIIIIGVLGVDRSKTTYWVITYGLMFVMFWRYMSKQQRKSTILISSVLLGLVLSYFVILTISRFGEREAETQGGLISYVGQSFINFCYFYEMVDYREFSLQRIFPLFYKLFIDNGIDSSPSLNAEISLKTGKSIAVFSTFMGDIMVASGKTAMIIYCIAYSFISQRFVSIKVTSKSFFYKLILVFCVITVPMLGLFVHFYANFALIIALLFFAYYALKSLLNNFKFK